MEMLRAFCRFFVRIYSVGNLGGFVAALLIWDLGGVSIINLVGSVLLVFGAMTPKQMGLRFTMGVWMGLSVIYFGVQTKLMFASQEDIKVNNRLKHYFCIVFLHIVPQTRHGATLFLLE